MKERMKKKWGVRCRLALAINRETSIVKEHADLIDKSAHLVASDARLVVV